MYKQLPHDELLHLAHIGKISAGLFHDLLNPIGSLLLYLEMVKTSQTLPETQTHIDHINESTKYIKSFIRMMQENLEDADPETITLHEVIQDILHILRHRAIMYGVRIMYAHTNQIAISCKKMRMYQVLLNLIANAIDSFENIPDTRSKHKTVTIETYDDRSSIFIRVVDTGCGMTQTQISNIYTINHSDKARGFGIGLRHTKDIIENEFMGTITISSKPKAGTTCTIKIPKHHHISER